MRSVVDLPAPFEPMSVTISPSSTVQADAAQRVDGAVVGVDVLELEQRHGQASSAAPRPRYASMTRGLARTSAGLPSARTSP